MKVTVELSEKELDEIRELTGESKKGPAIRKLVVDALMLERRRTMLNKFVSGEWSAELKGFEEGRALDREKARQNAERWRT